MQPCGDSSPSSCPGACQYVRSALVSEHCYTVTILHVARITASEGPSGYVVWTGVTWLPATQIQLVGLTAFCLETTNQSTTNGTQPKVGWQTCTMTADAWRGHQNVSFKAKAVLPYSMGAAPGLPKPEAVFLYN